MDSDSVYLCEGGSGYLILCFRDIILRNEVFNKIKNYLGKNFDNLFIIKPNFHKKNKRNLYLKNKKLPIPSSYLLEPREMFSLYPFGLNISNRNMTGHKRVDINGIVNTVILNNKIKTLKTEITKYGYYIPRVIIL